MTNRKQFWLQWNIMLPADAVGFILYVIATLVAYLLFHFYKHPLHNGTNVTGATPRTIKAQKKLDSKSSAEKARKFETSAPATGARSANNVISCGRYKAFSRQQSDTCLLNSACKWFPASYDLVEEENFER